MKKVLLTFIKIFKAFDFLFFDMDVLSQVSEMAWDVLSRVTKTAWVVLSRVANLCKMFCPGWQKMAWDVLSGSSSGYSKEPSQ